MDFGTSALLAAASYFGVGLPPARELKRLHKTKKVRSKGSADAGTVSRNNAWLEQEAEALERAGRKLQSAGHAVHQVEDLLQDTIDGIHSNQRTDLPAAANERLLRSAEELATDIVGYARFEDEQLFPELAPPTHFDARRALGADAAQSKAIRLQSGVGEPPGVREVLHRAAERLRGPDGVIQSLDVLAGGRHTDPAAASDSLGQIKDGARASRREIESVKREQVDRRLLELESGPI